MKKKGFLTLIGITCMAAVIAEAATGRIRYPCQEQRCRCDVWLK